MLPSILDQRLLFNIAYPFILANFVYQLLLTNILYQPLLANIPINFFYWFFGS